MHKLKKIWKDPVWSKVISWLIIAGITTLISLRAMNTSSTTIITSIILILGGAYSYYQITNTGIKFLHKGLGTGTIGAEVIQIYGFQARVKNKFQKPIKNFTGYLQSNTTNKTAPLYLNIDGNLYPPTETNGIPPKAIFNVTAPFVAYKKGEDLTSITPAIFFEEFGDFTVYFSLDGKVFQIHCSHRQNKKSIDKLRNQISPRQEPKITLK